MFRVGLVALLAALTVSTHHHLRNCSTLPARSELACAKSQLALAHQHPPYHSHGYWAWRERLARHWIKDARYLLSLRLPSTRDWQIAVRIVQRTWPGTAGWELSCSAHEGGHGPFVMNTEGSGAGGWMQYMQGTFDSHYTQALELARRLRLPTPPPGEGWTSPLGQAFAAGWGYAHNRSAWQGDPYC